MSRQKDVLGKLFAGPLRNLIEKLSGEEGKEWWGAFLLFLRHENPWPEIEKVAKKLLKLVASFVVPALDEFSAEDHFRVGEVDGVKIAFIGDNLRQNLLDMVVPATTETELKIYRLNKNSVDGPIITELGGQEAASITLSQFWAMLQVQGHGEKGNLLTDGRANIAYIAGWAVDALWYGHGWSVLAYSVVYPSGWFEGDQVLSRN